MHAFFILFYFLLPVLFVAFYLIEEYLRLRQELLHKSITWLDNEVYEPGLALCDIGGAPVHELAHVEVKLFLLVSLMKEFEVEKVGPLFG